MPDWSALLGNLSALQLVAWIVAAGLLITLLVKLWPFVRNAVAIVDALVQLPALSRQVGSMKSQIDSIHHETHNNDGSSIKDAVDRIEVGVAGLYERMDTVETGVKELHATDAELRAEIENTNPKKENPS